MPDCREDILQKLPNDIAIGCILAHIQLAARCRAAANLSGCLPHLQGIDLQWHVSWEQVLATSSCNAHMALS